MPDGPVATPESHAAGGLLARLPRHVADSLTPEQRRAIERALGGGATPPPVNIRLSFPILGWRCYLAVLAGRERRGSARREADRARHPLHTAGNFLFILGGAMGFYIMVLLAFLLNSSVLDY